MPLALSCCISVSEVDLHVTFCRFSSQIPTSWRRIPKPSPSLSLLSSSDSASPSASSKFFSPYLFHLDVFPISFGQKGKERAGSVWLRVIRGTKPPMDRVPCSKVGFSHLR
ncbi:hypothetical protein PILCRDRAFT_597069 [Piloderma croceum F 1598]|uniref:Uncharacterized protein n=1 Tax=Piloderma croceum (strain F 1598) TaxID=765440 RepID=A0A0C3FEJ5_PILCF|nr:hypothetical protein PILCRDRAFT_597069 [Piloderma croceum F 1598]